MGADLLCWPYDTQTVMSQEISATGPPDLEGTTSIARLFVHARRYDVDLSISSCPKFEKMAGLMDVPGTVYPSQEPYMDWHVEEIGRLEEMSGMAELRGLASKIRVGGGTVSGRAGSGGGKDAPV